MSAASQARTDQFHLIVSFSFHLVVHRHYTLVFNTFVFMQVFNLINARVVAPKDMNPFAGIFRNWMFDAIISLIAIFQVIICLFGGIVFKTNGLYTERAGSYDAILWASSIGFAAFELILGAPWRDLDPIAEACQVINAVFFCRVRFAPDSGEDGGLGGAQRLLTPRSDSRRLRAINGGFGGALQDLVCAL